MKILFVKITAALVAMLSPLSGTAESVTDDPCGYYLNKKPSSDYKLCTMAVERKVDFPELKFAYQLATADYAVKFCRGVELTEQERQIRAEKLNDPEFKKLYDEAWMFVNSVSIYSMENWCADYGGKKHPFVF
jgi:hypothetical protein